MADNPATAAPLRDALVALHRDLAALAQQPGLDPTLVAAADEALKQLRLAAALSAERTSGVVDQLTDLRQELCGLMESHDSKTMRHRAFQRAAAFVSGAICELRPSMLG